MIGVRSLGKALGLALLLATAATAASAQMTQIPPDGARIIDAFGECRSVRNLMTNPVMIPHKSRSEWSLGANSFLAKARTGLRVNSCDYRFADVAGSTRGSRKVCGVTFDGEAYCWGQTHPYPGGDSWSATPTRVLGLPSMRKLAITGTGFHCGVSTAGEVWCWGTQRLNQGNGKYKQVDFAPFKRSDIKNVMSIYSEEEGGFGYYQPYFCAIKTNGSLWCWQDDSWTDQGHGKIAEYDGDDPDLQMRQIDAGPVVQVSLGNEKGCYQKGDGSYWCFQGVDRFQPANTNRPYVWHRNYDLDPKRLNFVSGAPMTGGMSIRGRLEEMYDTDPRTHGFVGCVVESDGDLWCWDNQSNGGGSDRSWNWITRASADTTNPRYIRPTKITKFPGKIKLVSDSLYGVCVVNTANKVYCYSHYGRESTAPVWDWSNGQNFVKIIGRPGTDEYYKSGICLLDDDGGIWCVGENKYGMHGGATGTRITTPTLIRQ